MSLALPGRRYFVYLFIYWCPVGAEKEVLKNALLTDMLFLVRSLVQNKWKIQYLEVKEDQIRLSE